MRKIIAVLLTLAFIGCEKTEVSPEQDQKFRPRKTWAVRYEITTSAPFGLLEWWSYVNENRDSIFPVEPYFSNGIYEQTPWTYSFEVPRGKEPVHLSMRVVRVYPWGFYDPGTETLTSYSWTARIYVNDKVVAEKTTSDHIGQYAMDLYVAYDRP